MQSPAEIACHRLYPRFSDPNYLVLRFRRRIFTSWINQLREGPLKVLNVGSRYEPYSPLLERGIYVGLDVSKSEWAGVVADGQALPFAPESFDRVIGTQVFEHFSIQS